MILLLGNCQYFFFEVRGRILCQMTFPPTLVLPPFFVTTSVCPRFLERYQYYVRTNHACVIVMILLHKMWKEFPSRIFFRESTT